MFHILGFLFVIIVVILVIGLSIIGTVLRTIFGLGGKRRSSSGSYQSGQGYSYSGGQQPNSSSQTDEGTTSEGNNIHRKHKKLFSKDEGEYVDFEEINNQTRRFAAKKSFIKAAQSSARIPFTTTVFGCNACGA